MKFKDIPIRVDPTLPRDAVRLEVAERPQERPQPQMPDMVSMLKEAQEFVVASPLYRRFIAHTPLDNDIACWMADFARAHCARLLAEREAQR